MSSTPIDIALRQGPPRREFPGRVAAHPRRATAAPFWRSMNSCASPTTSPTTPRCKPDEKLALLDRLEAGLLGQHDEIVEASALRAALREREPVAAPCAGPA